MRRNRLVAIIVLASLAMLFTLSFLVSMTIRGAL